MAEDPKPQAGEPSGATDPEEDDGRVPPDLTDRDPPTILPTVHQRLQEELRLARGLDIAAARPLLETMRNAPKPKPKPPVERAPEIEPTTFFGTGRGDRPAGSPPAEGESERP
jgi:hypothetical protein